MELICLGDSLTYGYGVHISQRWTTLIANSLQCNVINLGVPGDTTSGMLCRMQNQVLPRLHNLSFSDMSATLLLGGCNDIFYSGSDSAARVNMGSMVHQLLTVGGKPAVLSPLPIIFSKIPSHIQPIIPLGVEYIQKAFYHWLEEFCRAFRVPFIDLYSTLSDDEGNPRPELYLDGLHPTPEGHSLIAKKVLADLNFKVI